MTRYYTPAEPPAPVGQTQPTALWGAFKIDLLEVRRQMLVHGWNAAELSRQAGVNPTTVGRFIRGLPVAPRTAYRLITALELKPDALITAR